MKKAPYKLKFKKWWWYLFPKRRKWLKEVNAIMTSPEVVSEIDQRVRKSLTNLLVYGTGICHPPIMKDPESVYGKSPIPSLDKLP